MDIRSILRFILDLYFFAILGWVILSWIPVTPGHLLGRIQRFLDRIIYPLILPLRRVIPPIRLGGGALDLSPIILLVGIQILRAII